MVADVFNLPRRRGLLDAIFRARSQPDDRAGESDDRGGEPDNRAGESNDRAGESDGRRESDEA